MAKKKEAAGLLIPAGLLIGLGVGAYIGNYAMGALLGLGAGFLAAALVAIFKK